MNDRPEQETFTIWCSMGEAKKGNIRERESKKRRKRRERAEDKENFRITEGGREVEKILFPRRFGRDRKGVTQQSLLRNFENREKIKYPLSLKSLSLPLSRNSLNLIQKALLDHMLPHILSENRSLSHLIGMMSHM